MECKNCKEIKETANDDHQFAIIGPICDECACALSICDRCKKIGIIDEDDYLHIFCQECHNEIKSIEEDISNNNNMTLQEKNDIYTNWLSSFNE